MTWSVILLIWYWCIIVHISGHIINGSYKRNMQCFYIQVWKFYFFIRMIHEWRKTWNKIFENNFNKKKTLLHELPKLFIFVTGILTLHLKSAYILLMLHFVYILTVQYMCASYTLSLWKSKKLLWNLAKNFKSLSEKLVWYVIFVGNVRF